jgi:molecular chaperone DnaK
VDAAAQELRKALQGTDTNAIRDKNEALKRVLQEVGASVYAKAQGQGQGPGQGQPPPGGPEGGANVSDANYKVVDEGK